VGVEVLINELANLDPAVLHQMVVDGPGLSQNALHLRTHVHRPDIASFVDTARVAGQAIEVSESHRVGVGETGLRGSDVLDALIKVKLSEGGGRRDKGGSGRNRQLAVHFLSSDSYTRDKEGIEISVRYHWNKRERESKNQR
jgi:hypothetical protein